MTSATGTLLCVLVLLGCPDPSRARRSASAGHVASPARPTATAPRATPASASLPGHVDAAWLRENFHCFEMCWDRSWPEGSWERVDLLEAAIASLPDSGVGLVERGNLMQRLGRVGPTHRGRMQALLVDVARNPPVASEADRLRYFALRALAQRPLDPATASRLVPPLAELLCTMPDRLHRHAAAQSLRTTRGPGAAEALRRCPPP